MISVKKDKHSGMCSVCGMRSENSEDFRVIEFEGNTSMLCSGELCKRCLKDMCVAIIEEFENW